MATVIAIVALFGGSASATAAESEQRNAGSASATAAESEQRNAVVLKLAMAPSSALGLGVSHDFGRWIRAELAAFGPGMPLPYLSDRRVDALIGVRLVGRDSPARPGKLDLSLLATAGLTSLAQTKHNSDYDLTRTTRGAVGTLDMDLTYYGHSGGGIVVRVSVGVLRTITQTVEGQYPGFTWDRFDYATVATASVGYAF